ncbi:DUF5672 family protein [Pedobacter sandarakinus]|uniref:DUF5672 family protein n=1 Tax=Pedobacter sandarakinus TaxID=353156 RepID=UPI002248465B|nr:DUF5672 family protein [Pedobacter sandarakinus]MCX2575926.1 DUF5672 family protein [Pedobacter sandarakinus]
MRTAQTLVAIVIPIYKAHPEDEELHALAQCFKILKKHEIIFVGPDGLNTMIYSNLAKENNIRFRFLSFACKYFDDLSGYNQLMLSPHFYETFLSYKFILIYQLDAFVFSDELEYWCNQNYDFIGAPQLLHANQKGEMQFLKTYSRIAKIFNHTVRNVGNGGFSLRKTHSCYLLVKHLRKQVERWNKNNEDGFFKYWGNILYPIFRLPKDETAMKFSIEMAPSTSVAKLNGKLPFGCHAYQKYDWHFWEPFIR